MISTTAGSARFTYVPMASLPSDIRSRTLFFFTFTSMAVESFGNIAYASQNDQAGVAVTRNHLKDCGAVDHSLKATTHPIRCRAFDKRRLFRNNQVGP
jgi:hypothetical protein